MQQLASILDKDLIIELQQELILRQGMQITNRKTLDEQKDKMINEQAKMIKLLEAPIEVLENNQKKNSSNSTSHPVVILVKCNTPIVYGQKAVKNLSASLVIPAKHFALM